MSDTKRITVRMGSVDLGGLNSLAKLYGVSRNELITILAQNAIQNGFVPLKPGHGLEARIETGDMNFSQTDSGVGTAVFSLQESGMVTSGRQGIPQSSPAFQASLDAATFASNGNWAMARSVLERAGFTITNITN